MAGEISAQPSIAGSAVANADKVYVLDVSATSGFDNSGAGGTIRQLDADEIADIPAVLAALNTRLFVIVCDEGDWADAPIGSIVHWIQPDWEGTSPPEGGRPGREPYDLVDIAAEP